MIDYQEVMVKLTKNCVEELQRLQLLINPIVDQYHVDQDFFNMAFDFDFQTYSDEEIASKAFGIVTNIVGKFNEFTFCQYETTNFSYLDDNIFIETKYYQDDPGIRFYLNVYMKRQQNENRIMEKKNES